MILFSFIKNTNHTQGIIYNNTFIDRVRGQHTSCQSQELNIRILQENQAVT